MLRRPLPTTSRPWLAPVELMVVLAEMVGSRDRLEVGYVVVQLVAVDVMKNKAKGHQAVNGLPVHNRPQLPFVRLGNLDPGSRLPVPRACPDLNCPDRNMMNARLALLEFATGRKVNTLSVFVPRLEALCEPCGRRKQADSLCFVGARLAAKPLLSGHVRDDQSDDSAYFAATLNSAPNHSYIIAQSGYRYNTNVLIKQATLDGDGRTFAQVAESRVGAEMAEQVA